MMTNRKHCLTTLRGEDTRVIVVAAVLMLVSIGTAHAAPVFFGPTPYLSSADVPNGFYAGGNPVVLENFEDDSLDFGISASAGSIIDRLGRIPFDDVDSVDVDDGVIDGSGSLGRSWFQPAGNNGVTFTFASPVTAAGLVWTDSLAAPIVFEAFGPGMASLGVFGPVTLGDTVFTGTTAEDRFFGVQDVNGIVALRMTVLTAPGTSGLEVDHVQFGNAVPLPGAIWLFGSGLLAIAGFRKARTGTRKEC